MGTDKRARQKSNRRAAIDHAREEAARRRRRQRLVTYGAIALVGVFFIGLVAWLLSRGDDEVVSNDPPPDSGALFGEDEGGTDDPPSPRPDEGPAELPAPGGDACPPEDGSADQQREFDDPPPLCIEPDATYRADIATNFGDIEVILNSSAAPLTVNNFVVLSRYHFYDGAEFHRVIDDFMIQGGDPVGDPPGTGGPGYTFADELPAADYVYNPGDLAMANSGPATNGSQFFIVTKDTGVDWLAGNHTLFGKVTAGMEAVEAIEALDSGDGTPSEAAIIESITITQVLDTDGNPIDGETPGSSVPDPAITATTAVTTTDAPATSTTEG